MAFADVKFPQAFWSDMGLAHLFFPEGIPQEEAAPKLRPAKTPPPPAPRAAAQKWQRETPPPAPSVAPAAAPTARQAAFTPLKPELWPLDWQKRLMATPKAKVAWTYWKLNDDLTAGKGGKDAEYASRKNRSQLLRNLFRDLAMPQGSHTFWPACLPDEAGDPKANPQIFWSGVLELNCRGVVILGSQAALRLLPQKGLRPLEELRMAGRLAWILREPDALAENPTWYKMALSFLRNAFRTHIR